LRENGWIDPRAPFFIDAAWAAGDDQALGGGEFGGGSFAGPDLGVNAKVPNFAGDQMTILTACVQDKNLRMWQTVIRDDPAG